MSYKKTMLARTIAVALATAGLFTACTGYDNSDSKPIAYTVVNNPTQSDVTKSVYYTQDLSQYLSVNLEISNASVATYTWYAVPLTDNDSVNNALRSLSPKEKANDTDDKAKQSRSQSQIDNQVESKTEIDTDMQKKAVKLVVRTKDVTDLEDTGDKLSSASYLNAWYYCTVELKNSVYTETYTTQPVLLMQSLKNDGIDTVVINTIDGQPIQSNIKTEDSSNKAEIAQSVKATVIYKNNYDTYVSVIDNNIFNQDKKSYQFACGSTIYNLLDMYCDKSLMRTSFTNYLINNIFTKLTPQAEYKSVHLVLNGSYQGLYLITTSPEDNGLFTMTEGKTPVSSYNITTKGGIDYSITSPKTVDAKTANFIKETIQTAEEAVYTLSNYNYVLDVDQIVDYYLLTLLTKNSESPLSFVYDTDSKLLKAGPVILADNSMGGDTDTLVQYSDFLNHLLQDNIFKARVLSRYKEIKDKLAQSSIYIEDNYQLLQEGAKANFNRWPILGTYVTPDDPGYAERTTYKDEVTYFADWVDARLVWMEEYLADEFLLY